MKSLLTLLFSITLIFTACSGGNSGQQADSSGEPEQEQGLSDFEMEHGIGPITERIDISDDIDEDLRVRGQEIFEMKCEMCHNMEGRMVGPALGDVAERRSPEYLMNMVLNPGGMARNHPEGQKLVQEYMTVMPFQNVTEEDARALVEYLRDYSMNN
ncbi:c-type cytochrome [Rhodohalobacter halophilus]|uniref:c-type cytochrome n=1 Tax=Rhodohalobacter halophilus TaxID=1812810 RepID=UPI00083F5729|nr:cytochrome c [Rhodohalobacter halophilus]